MLSTSRHCRHRPVIVVGRRQLWIVVMGSAAIHWPGMCFSCCYWLLVVVMVCSMVHDGGDDADNNNKRVVLLLASSVVIIGRRWQSLSSSWCLLYTSQACAFLVVGGDGAVR